MSALDFSEEPLNRLFSDSLSWLLGHWVEHHRDRRDAHKRLLLFDIGETLLLLD